MDDEFECNARNQNRKVFFWFSNLLGLLLLRNSINYHIWSIETYRLDCVFDSINA